MQLNVNKGVGVDNEKKARTAERSGCELDKMMSETDGKKGLGQQVEKKWVRKAKEGKAAEKVIQTTKVIGTLSGT